MTVADVASKQPQTRRAGPKVVVVGRSQIFFWWPIWVYGFFMTVWSYFVDTNAGVSSTYGVLSLIYVFLLLFILTFTNLRLPPAFFFISALLLIILVILVKQNTMLKILPFIFRNLRVNMNFEFYLVMTLGTLAIWLFSVFIYDRGVTWDIHFHQINIRNRYSHADEDSINAVTAHFSRSFGDFVCHWVLGLGMVGDLHYRLDNGRRDQMRNVLFVRTKTKEIESVFRS